MVNPIDQGYITVAERLAAFTRDYPNGLISTELENFIYDPSEGKGFAVVSASVWKMREQGYTQPDGTGLSSMPIPGPTNFTKNSEVENAETSAIGRALAAIGYLAKDETGKARIASAEEIAAKSDDTKAETKDGKMTARQRGKMFSLAKDAGIDTATDEGTAMLRQIVLDVTGKHSSKQLLSTDMDALFGALEEMVKVKEATGGGEFV